MGGSSEHRVTETLVEARFAPYLEAYHESFLAFTHNQSLAAIAVNPYSTYASTWADIDYAFFCVGCSISDYPALYDMFGKHMSGLDIEIFHRACLGLGICSTTIDSCPLQTASAVVSPVSWTSSSSAE